ncbi:MAG: glycosyltransferase family 9 protein [Gammaproteobacteria bacterium]
MHVTGDRIGDALIKWPVIVALKAALPAHRLVWLAGRRRSVFTGPLAGLAAGVIDEVRDLAGIGVAWSELLRRAYPGEFDIIIATEPKLRTALLLRRIRHNIFISPAIGFRLSHRRPVSAYPDSAFEQFRTLATLAAGRELDVHCTVEPGEPHTSVAAALLPADAGYVGFAPGSAGARKRWPLERFVELARVQAAAGRKPVFFLGPEEASLTAELRIAVPDALFPEQADAAAGGGPLLSIALARRLDGAVANDAGGGHLLAAGGRGVITLFGHTSPEKFKPPYGTRIAITARDFGGTTMAAIPVPAVAAALERLLTELAA